MSEPPATPIVVRENPAKEISAQTVRVFLLSGLSMGAGFFIRSEVVLAAVLPALTIIAGCVAGVLAIYIAGLLKFLKDWRARLTMARHLPDDLAKTR
jgi:hypothetical protein